MERKFKDGDKVKAGSNLLTMLVLDATLCLKGWRYKLGFPKKDGTLDKRRDLRFFWEEEIKPL